MYNKKNLNMPRRAPAKLLHYILLSFCLTESPSYFEILAISKEQTALKTMPTAIKRYYYTAENFHYIDMSVGREQDYYCLRQACHNSAERIQTGIAKTSIFHGLNNSERYFEDGLLKALREII